MTDRSRGRAVSITFSYVALLAVAAAVTTGVIIVAGDMASQQRDRTIENQLTVIGEQLSAELSVADRLARTHTTSKVEIQRQFPERVGGKTYDITIDTNPETISGGPALHLEAAGSDVEVEVAIDTVEDVDTSSVVDGGTVVVEFSGSDLVISNG